MKMCLTRVTLTILVSLTFLACESAIAQEKHSYADLVKRMTDLEHLATLPAEGNTCRQWSSWDRKSQYDEKTGKYVGWDANGDGGGVIRAEGDQVVMAEMEGPGCIWRIWSARPLKGHVKIYLDGQEQPAVDMPFADYFDGKHAPFNYPLLSYRLDEQGCKGENLYVPIPYQKSCKIVADKGWGNYYQFVYETFPKGTQLPTFSRQLAEQNAAALQQMNDFLTKRLGEDPAGRREKAVERIGMNFVDAGKTAVVADLAGPAAITAIRVGRMAFKDREDEIAAMRKLVLKITWDDEKEPAVWCPLGDFFGTAPGVNKYKSIATGMTDEEFYALWYMPFGKKAVVELVNDDTVPRGAQFAISVEPLTKPMDKLGYFHCKWHRDIFPVTPDRMPDWTILKTEGRGRFCGVMLHVWNPRGGWWGEGDEKFFVDNEKFPSTFGTGSEDYFGYAWCDPHLFQRPFHCQTMTQMNAGHQSVLRWHLSDNIPFQNAFEAAIEKYYPNNRCLFACTAVWYLARGGQDPIQPAPVAERHGYWIAMPISAAGFKVLGTPKGNVEEQGMRQYKGGKWTDDNHLWWTGAKPGNKLDLALPVQESGAYRLSVVLTKARDYGIVQFSLDGKKIGEPIDLYNPEVVPTDSISLGTQTLEAGEHKLTVEIVGANSKALKSYMFGIDRVILEK